jgi:hypothetical protein
MWELYNHSKLWGSTPAQLLSIRDEYDAWCLNEATAYLGATITNELEKIEGKDSKSIERKRNNKLNQLLGVSDEKRFRQVGGKKPKKEVKNSAR